MLLLTLCFAVLVLTLYKVMLQKKQREETHAAERRKKQLEISEMLCSETQYDAVFLPCLPNKVRPGQLNKHGGTHQRSSVDCIHLA